MRNTGIIKKVLCGGAFGLYEMAYREWGDPTNENTLICVHGLTRNSLDFCQLAEALSSHYRVIAPDVVGRGLSDDLVDPMRYDVTTYCNDIITLLAHLNANKVDWVGTSMGGQIAMMLASQVKSPIRKLVLNDVGPSLSSDTLKRITSYVGQHSTFDSKEEAYSYLAKILAPMSMHTEKEWDELFDDSLKVNKDGKLSLNYDPHIKLPLKKALLSEPFDMWPFYNLIKIPTLLIHGRNSDLLSSETAELMTKSGPMAKLITVNGVGHAPMFKNDEQIKIIRDFLV